MAPTQATGTMLIVLCGLLAAIPGTRSATGASSFLKAGDAAVSRSEWNQAINLYSDAIAADGSAVLAYTKRAAAHSGLQNYKAALRDFNSALDLDTSSVSILLKRGRLRRDLCDFAGAEADFRAVLAIKASHRAAETELDGAARGIQALEAARMARDTGDAAATRVQLATLFGLAAHCSEAKLMEAALLLGERDYSGAVAITGQVLKAEPSSREALLTRSRAYFMLADLDMAKRHLGEALKYDPDNRAAMADFRKIKRLAKSRSQGDAALARRDWAAANAAFIDALWVDQAADAVNSALWLGLCTAQLQLDDTTEAVRSCTAAADMIKEAPEPRVLKVRALIADRQFDAAVAEARAALDAHRNVGAVHEVVQEAEKAKKMAERKDYYAILGVTQEANARDVKQAYRLKAKSLHPDKAAQQGISKETAERQFHDLAEAYEVLSDDEKRRRYDRGEDVEVNHQQQHPGHPNFGGWPGNAHFHFQHF